MNGMKDRFPEEGTIHTALEMAVRAPSLHNSQPWRWQIADGRIDLFADHSRLLRAADPDGRELVISCGAALHHLRVALAALGWSSTVRRLPDRSEPRHLASFELEPSEPTPDAVLLAAQIARRRSDRRPYRSWDLPPFALVQMNRNAAAAGITLRVVGDPDSRKELSMAIAAADDIESVDDGYRSEVASWSGQHFGVDDGVPARSVPADGSYDGVRLRHFAHPEMPPPTESDFEKPDVGTLLILSSTSDDIETWLRAGEATAAILLTATGSGLAACPLTQPLELATTRRLVRDAVLDGRTVPHMILRVGWPVTADAPPSTPRRPVAEVLDRFDDMAGGLRFAGH